jgi:hypothetical protein
VYRCKKKGSTGLARQQRILLGSDYGYTALLKDISHFKISCSPEEGLKAKAYLRVTGIYLKELFKTNAITWLHRLDQRYSIGFDNRKANLFQPQNCGHRFNAD